MLFLLFLALRSKKALKVNAFLFLLALKVKKPLKVNAFHAFFAFPEIGLLITFCMQGLGWLATAPASPGLFPTDWHALTLLERLTWFYIAVYAVYGCETESSFVADSRNPQTTLRCLGITAGCIPVVYVGGSWLLMQLSSSDLGDSTYLHLTAASTYFWGGLAPALVTFLITSEIGRAHV